MSEVKVFCALPEYSGYSEEGFGFTINYKIFQSDPSQVVEDQAQVTAPLGTPPSSIITALYTAIITKAAAIEFPTPSLSSIYMYVPFSLEKLAQGQSSVTRALDTAYQVSATSNVLVNYCVDIESVSNDSGSEQGTVYLEVADDSGFTTNVQEVSRSTNGNTGTLTAGLDNTQILTARLAGGIKVGKYARLRTQSNTGSPSFTYRSGQEIIA